MLRVCVRRRAGAAHRPGLLGERPRPELLGHPAPLSPLSLQAGTAPRGLAPGSRRPPSPRRPEPSAATPLCPTDLLVLCSHASSPAPGSAPSLTSYSLGALNGTKSA